MVPRNDNAAGRVTTAARNTFYGGNYTPTAKGIDTLLSRLDRVKQTGQGRWLARCPAHEDRNPSLSIRELEDGCILVNDFAGCPVESVLSAVGMALEDLFPESLVDRKPERRPWSSADILRIVHRECLILLIAFEDLLNGKNLSREDMARAQKAAVRIRAAIEEAGYAR
jgi:hypothetical protein